MRLFTAICFDDETKKLLFSAGKTAEEKAKGSFSRKENLHLTLVFIGETERFSDIKKAISEIEFPAFDYKIEGTGTFEKGIFWAGIEENENLRKLYEIIKKKLSDIGIETEERKYIPHITLARKFKAESGFDFAEVSKKLPQKIQRADRISLMVSERMDGVLCYTEVFSKNLTQ